MKFLMMAASLHQTSINKLLINQAANIVTALNHQVDLAQFNEFPLPLYDQDIQDNAGIPEEVMTFIQRMHAADAVIFSCPEYNFSIPGTFKNLIDWVSRVKPMPWKNQRILLLSASPSMIGGNRGLWTARMPLEACGSIVYPEMFSLAQAHQAFDAQGTLSDANMQQRLNSLLNEFIEFTTNLA